MRTICYVRSCFIYGASKSAPSVGIGNNVYFPSTVAIIVYLCRNKLYVTWHVGLAVRWQSEVRSQFHPYIRGVACGRPLKLQRQVGPAEESALASAKNAPTNKHRALSISSSHPLATLSNYASRHPAQPAQEEEIRMTEH